jgi:hypothetical protein
MSRQYDKAVKALHAHLHIVHMLKLSDRRIEAAALSNLASCYHMLGKRDIRCLITMREKFGAS